jgi:alkaline phosphatase D
MPHYATWDDHDYGPNDIGGNYILKDKSRHVFKSYWANPSYGENEEGIYTMVSYGDVDIFLCDDRWWRSDPRLKDTINGQPNNDKTMLGAKQMNWLQNSLLHNNATFKIVVVGTQVLNPGSTVDKLLDYKYEYNKLMQFLNDAKIDGVLFLTGDRHHSEVIKVERPGTYPLYDITVSPLTSGVAKFSGKEANNSYRVLGYDKGQNYGRFSFSGPKGQRKLTVEFLGVKGERVGEWNISEAALKTPGQ